MRKNYNTLHKYIYDNSVKEYSEKTVTGLFRAITEPVITNQNNESLILIKTQGEDEYNTQIKRLGFSQSRIISYSENISGYTNNSASNIWGSTEFIVIISSRYSAALIWDYETSTYKGKTQVCLLYNSRKISEIAKIIDENSKETIKDLINKYGSERRENSLLNNSIRSIADKLNETNEEVDLTIAERDNLGGIEEETYKTAQIVAEKARFTAHEIKNNISIINIYTKILEKRLEKTDTDAQTKESIETSIRNINKASETISYIINDLRCYSKPNISGVNIKQLIQKCVEQSKAKAEAAGAEITASNIPDKEISADKGILECCIINIILNAADACKTGCKIDIKVISRDLKTIIQISNNGEKIKEEDAGKIFDLDFTTKKEGTGAGLYICKKQLEKINGDIRLVHSNEEETLFEITV